MQSIANRWLRITILASENTGLVQPEVYYIGHLLGETTGIAGGLFTVSFTDAAPIRSAIGQTAIINSTIDIDKNGTVSFADISAMRPNVGAQLTNITIPAAASSGGQALMSSGVRNDRPKKGDSRGFYLDDSWQQMAPLIDAVWEDFGSRSKVQVDSEWRERGSAAGGVIANPVTVQLPGRQNAASVDWIFQSMGEGSERSERRLDLESLELKESLEDIGLLAEDALVR
jgi:hypothetical protein